MRNTNKITWRFAKLGDVMEFKYGFGLPENKRTNGNVPVYGSSGIVGMNDKEKVNSQGIIIGRKGNVGSVYYSEKPFYPIDTVYYVDKLKHGGDLKFFYYFLKRIPFKKIGSDVGVPGLNRDMAYHMEIYFPNDVEVQKRIASILSSFDDKIELNNKISQNLEQTAQAIFKEWFSSSQRGKEYSLYDLAKYVNGGAFKNFINHDKKGIPLIKIADLNRGLTDNTEWINCPVDKKYYINDGDLLFSWSASLGIYIWDKGSAILNQHIFKVEPTGEFGLGFLYFLLKSKIRLFQHLAGAKATSMGHIKKENLIMETIFIPQGVEFDVFDSIYKKIVNLKIENQKLTALRDSLLPKMMSGEVRV